MLKNRSLFCLFLFMAACTATKQSTTLNYKGYRIEKQTQVDSSIIKLLMPYADSINKTMNNVIGFSTRGLTKRQPESELGNFLTDAIKEMAEKKFGKKVDAAFINFGGIRSYIPKGDITTGKVYELMPFDNLIILQDLKGSTLKLFLDKMADRGGVPQSGLKFQLKEKKAINILVDGKPLEMNANYTIANSDYIANGGDDCDMLRSIPQQNKGYLMRDAFIEFIKQKTKEGKAIDWKTDGRVTY